MFHLQVDTQVWHPARHLAAQLARRGSQVRLPMLDHWIPLGVDAAAYVATMTSCGGVYEKKMVFIRHGEKWDSRDMTREAMRNVKHKREYKNFTGRYMLFTENTYQLGSNKSMTFKKWLSRNVCFLGSRTQLLTILKDIFFINGASKFLLRCTELFSIVVISEPSIKIPYEKQSLSSKSYLFNFSCLQGNTAARKYSDQT